MATVSSVLVRRSLATMRQVEDALARQLLYGGDVITCLLEVAPTTDERAMLAAIADEYDLVPATLDAFRSPSAEAVARVPQAIVEELGIAPIALRDDRVVLAVTEPLTRTLEQTIARAIGAPVAQAAASYARLRQAMNRGYGTPIDERLTRLLERLDADVPASPRDRQRAEATTDPPVAMDEAASDAPAEAAQEADSTATDLAEQPDAAASAPTDATTSGAEETIASPPEPVVEAAPKPRTREAKSGIFALHKFVRATAPRATGASTTTLPASTSGTSATETPALPGATTKLGTKAAATTRRRRGPFTRERAEEALSEATTPDEVLTTVLEFVAQYAEHVAIFRVHDDLAEGWGARGQGATGERVREMGVPLDMPSLFSKARDERRAIAGARGETGIDGVIGGDLGRAQGGDVAVLPIVVGKRVVALVRIDNGEDAVILGELVDVTAVVARAATALAQVAIRRRKRNDGAPMEKGSDKTKADGEAGGPRADAVAAAEAIAERARANDASRSPPPAKTTTDAARPPVASTPPKAISLAPIVQPISSPPPSEPVPTSREIVIGPARKPTERGFPAATEAIVDPPENVPQAKADDAPLTTTERAPFAKVTLTKMAAVREEDPTYRPGGAIEARSTSRASSTESSEGTPASPTAQQGAPTAERAWWQRDDVSPPEEPLPRPDGHASAPRRISSQRGVSTPTQSGTTRAADSPIVESAGDSTATTPAHETAAAREADLLPPPPAFAARRPLAPLIPREENEDGPKVTRATTNEGDASSDGKLEVSETALGPEAIEQLLAEAAAAHLEASVPPGGRVEAHGLRAPPASRAARSSDRALPKVMVAHDAEHVTLVDRLMRGGRAAEEATQELVRLGARVLPAVMERFPGPTSEDRASASRRPPTADRAGPILALLARIGRPALRDVLARTSDPSPESRFWATLVLTSLVDIDAADAIVPRMLDDDAPVRAIAVTASRTLLSLERRTAPRLVDPLVVVLLDRGAPTPLRIRSAVALGELREGRAAEGLVLALQDAEGSLFDAISLALITLTRANPPAGGGTWAAWLSRNLDRHRVEWLIDALLADDEALREGAAADLKEATKVYFGYYASLPRVERERAHRRYREWWDEEGRGKHVAS